MKLTVIVTVFNEVKTIDQAIKDIENIKEPDKEIIIIDNFSTDGTREILRALPADKYQVVYNEKNLVCGSVPKGMKLARGEYVYVHHSDLEYAASSANVMLEIAEQGGYDIVLGSRLKNNRDPFWKIISQRPEYLATLLCTWLINRWYGQQFTDIIGSRLYRRASFLKIPVTTKSQGFEFESISRMCRRGYKMAEVAIAYHPRSWQEGKKIRPYHIINALIAMIRVRLFG